MANPTIGATTPRIQYTATASQTVFTVPFEFLANADLAVYVNGTLKTLTTDYTLTGANTTGGGSLTFVTGRTAGEIVTILGNLAYSRDTNKYTKYGLLPAEVLEADFDALQVQAKQLALADQFAIRAPLSDTGSPAMTLPVVATRASKALGFDASGNPTVSTNSLSAIDAATTIVNTIGAAPSSDASTITYTPDGESTAVLLDAAVDTLNSATRQTQQLMQRLKFGEECNLIVLGDSTGDATTEWIYLLAVKLGVDFPTHTVRYRAWDTGTGDYGSITTIQTGTGGVNLNIWNASVAGSTAIYFAGSKFELAVRPTSMGQDPDLVILSYGHNGGSAIERQYTMTGTMAAEISRFMPFTPIILIGQNPVTTDSTMAEKVRVFRALAVAQNYGWIDVHAYFRQFASPLASYYADTIHPNSLGSALWANAAHQAFQLNRNEVSGNGVSTLNRGVIVANDSYAYFSEWTAVGLTLAREASIFETNGESAKLTGSGTVSAYIYKDVISSSDITAYRGKYVTVNVRVRVPDSAGADAGRVALYDGTTTTLSASGGPKQSTWFSQSITAKVGTGATYLRVYLYLNTSTGTTDEIYLDRMTVSDGPLPVDCVTPTEIHDLDFLQVFGSKSSGVMVMRNANTGTRGLQILDTAGSDQDNPETQYTTSLNAIGLYGKAKADAYDRIQVNGQTGYIYFGLGTVAPSGYFRGGVGANEIRCGAALYPDATGTRTLGSAGIRWSTTYTDLLRLGSSEVLFRSGSGTPEAFVTAPVGSIYTRTDGGASTTLYVKESGTGNTGWVAK